MHDTDGGFPDDVPVADAVEQQRPRADSPLDEEDATSASDESEIALETNPADWQEQQETVRVDPESDELDLDS